MPSQWNNGSEREARSAVRRAFNREIRRVAALQNPFVAIVGIITLGTLGIVSVTHGVNGTVLNIIIAAIAGIAGYAVHAIRRFGHNEKE